MFVCRVVAFSFFLRLSVFLWELPDIIIYTHRHRCCRVFVTLLWSAGQISVNRLMLRLEFMVLFQHGAPDRDVIVQRVHFKASQALCMPRHIRPSVCLSVYPSVTLQYCVKMRECRGCGLNYWIAQCLQFSDEEIGPPRKVYKIVGVAL